MRGGIGQFRYLLRCETMAPRPTMPEQLQHMKDTLGIALPVFLVVAAIIVMTHKGRWK
jgi:hypothetical protein